MKVARAYNILTNLIQQGFDAVGLRYHGIYIVLKTLSSKETRLVKYHASEDDTFSMRVYELAYATFMINGDNFLEDRSSNIKNLVEVYKKATPAFLDVLQGALNELQANAAEATEYLEGYSYTDKSRGYWTSTKGSGLLLESTTGIQGTSSLGINTTQAAWVIRNDIMDGEVKQDRDFGNSLFVASASNPEGVKKTTQSVKNSREMLDTDRAELAMYGNAENRRRIVALSQGKDGKNVWTADIGTADSMVAQLDREMQGYRDRHDLFIEKHEKAQTDKIRAAQAEDARKAKELRDKIKNQEVFQGHRAVTKEEMDAHIRGEIDLKQVDVVGGEAQGMFKRGKRVLSARRP